MFLTNAASVLEYALQPIVDSHTGDLYGIEALLRNVEQLDCTYPSDVFDKAYELNCLVELELILRRKAIAKLASARLPRNTRLFLNVDARLLETENDLTAKTAELLSEYGFTPAIICLELSEAKDISSAGQTKHFIAEARRLDFSIAIDDFGKGFSQLKSLYDFEPEIIKIDRFFVQSIQSDARKRLLVSSAVELAHVLGMRVVAEGVETRAEFLTCREIGCDLIQGYLISHPTTRSDDILDRYPQAIDTSATTTATATPDGISNPFEDLLKREIKPLIALRDDARMDEVLTMLRAGRAYPFIPVINAADEPRGLIKEADIKELIYMPFGQDLLRNKAVNNRVKSFLHRCPIADLHSKLDQLIGLIANEDDQSGGVIVTKNGKYYGFLTTSSLLKIANEIRMRAAEDQNPLSKLPGNGSVTSFVVEEATRSDTERSFCYIDFDHFKPFNDAYGFRTGDRALLLFSELARRCVADQEDFIGHIGGDDFFIGFKKQDFGKVQQVLIDLRNEFRHQAESFYDAKHREDGYILSKDRAGIDRKFSLLTCSIAVVHLPKGLRVDDQDILWRQIALMKQQAKESADGLATTTFGQNFKPSKAVL
ncbi:GGDEF domain-containing protein [Roseibium limicola]|nr:GGDEF domain-containing protein [Roseibium limicola]